MKKVILLAAAIIGFSNFSFAQTAQTPQSATQAAHQQMTPEQRAKTMTDKMQQKLNLTPSQNQSIYKVNLDIANRVATARANHDKAAMQNIRAYRQAEFKKILTNDQFAIVQKSMTANRRNKNTATE